MALLSLFLAQIKNLFALSAEAYLKCSQTSKMGKIRKKLLGGVQHKVLWKCSPNSHEITGSEVTS